MGLLLWALPDNVAAAGDQRQGWRRLDPDAAQSRAPAAGLAVQVGDLTAILPAGSGAITLLCQPSPKADAIRQELTVLDNRGQPAGAIGDVSVRHDAGEVVVSFSAGNAQARLRMALGKRSVEIVPGRGAASLRIRGRARFSFIPDFFGHDVLYDPREIGAKSVYAPAESFFVNLMDGHGALTMITWPAGGSDEVLLLPEGDGADRRLAATQIPFAGKSIFVAVLAGEGILV